MQKTILIGGKAGQGIAAAAYLLGKALTQLGFYVFDYRDYQSLIRGGHNFNTLSFSDRPVRSHMDAYDLIVALDQQTIEEHAKDLKPEGWVIGDKGLAFNKLISVDLESILKELNAPTIAANTVLVGAACKFFDLPIQPLLSTIEERFKEKSKIPKSAAAKGYEAVEAKESLPVKGERKYFISGSEAVSIGALAAGLDVYLAYPMTPATPVLHQLAKEQLKHDILVAQLENEIAVVNAGLGASYAGAKVMVGTSGGGFALMAEATSLQGMSEIPLVIYLAQRASPSTGTPTYTAQSDLKFALNVGHGEFPRVIVAPGDAKEAFYRTIEAFYLAYKYRVLAIILSDKHLGESHYTYETWEEPKLKVNRFLVKPAGEYKSYKLTDTGVSPRAVPGEALVRASSWEHDEDGITSDKPDLMERMCSKRLKKEKSLMEEIKKLDPITVYGKGENLVVGWGSTKGAILDALNEVSSFRFLQISYISPFPSAEVKKELESSAKVILVENNATGLLGQVIAEQTGHLIKDKILKYDGRPFTSKYLVKAIRAIEWK